MDTLYTVGSFLGCLILCSIRPSVGIGFGLFVGSFYGIIRANYPGFMGYFFFDATLIGIYMGCLVNRPFMARPTPREITKWLIPMLIWPCLLIWVEGNILVSLVGLRAAVFFPLFVLLGMRLDSDELLTIGRFLALAAIAATIFAGLESQRGVDQFYPRNDVTALIYNSNDVVVEGKHYLRIPAIFANAASYAAAMVIFVPMMVHGLERERPWLKPLFAVGLVCCVLGVFISTSRSAVAYLGFTAIYVLLRNPTILFNRYLTPVALALTLLAYNFVEDNPRFHRFKSLGDEDVITERVAASNEGISLIDMAIEYPFGGGLALTGVSIPKFIKRTTPSIVTENEYARIIGTQGIPGFILIMGFFLRCIMAGLKRHPGMSSITSDATTGILIITLISGFIGVGAFAGVPAAAALFLILGFQATAARTPDE